MFCFTSHSSFCFYPVFLWEGDTAFWSICWTLWSSDRDLHSSLPDLPYEPRHICLLTCKCACMSQFCFPLGSIHFPSKAGIFLLESLFIKLGPVWWHWIPLGLPFKVDQVNFKVYYSWVSMHVHLSFGFHRVECIFLVNLSVLQPTKNQVPTHWWVLIHSVGTTVLSNWRIT